MENNKLYITDGDYMLVLKMNECVQLELKLNITKYGFDWKHIGDVLFKFGTQSANKLHVTAQQLNFLIKIHKMTYKEVQKMVD